MTNKTPSWLCNQTNCSSIFAFQNKTWRYYDPTKPDTQNTLKTVDETIGLWVNVNKTSELSLEGSPFKTSTISLLEGWNLIGYPLLYTSSIDEKLNKINFSIVYSYKEGKWNSYIKEKDYFLNSLKSLTPGYGYWIYSNNATTITIT